MLFAPFTVTISEDAVRVAVQNAIIDRTALGRSGRRTDETRALRGVRALRQGPLSVPLAPFTLAIRNGSCHVELRPSAAPGGPKVLWPVWPARPRSKAVYAAA